MKVFTAIASSLFAITASSTQFTVYYNQGYDNGARSLDQVACYNGETGLNTLHGWTKQSQVSSFPRIGAHPDTQHNSDKCGNCYSVTYGTTTIYYAAIDYGATPILSQTSMDALTFNNAVSAGHVNAEVLPVDSSFCSSTHQKRTALEFNA